MPAKIRTTQRWSPFFEKRCPAKPLYRVDGFQIVRCRQSGLVYLANPLNPDELEKFYSVEYFEGDNSRKGYASYKDDEETLRINFSHHVDEISRVLKKHRQRRRNLRLMDYGCAYGYFLDECRPHFQSVHGIELNPDVARIGRESFGLDIRSAGSLREGFPDERFDVITMWDVIEHLDRPRSVLRECWEMLEPGGMLFLTTGDIDSLLARALGRRWRLINPPQHICYFSRRTLSALLNETGFEVLAAHSSGKKVSLGFIAYILSYLVGYRSYRADSLPKFLRTRNISINLFDVVFLAARKKAS